jgi:hypothetical protein
VTFLGPRKCQWLGAFVVVQNCGVDGNFTTQPVAATWGADPEWVDLPGLKSRFSIGRSAAYTLIENGDIRSICLRRRGCVKGRRLVEVQSVRELFARQLDEVDPRLFEACKAANRKMQKNQKAKREKETAR